MRNLTKALSIVLTAVLTFCVIIPVSRNARAAERTRTVMMYCVGSDLESSDMLASGSLVRAMESEYNENLNFIVMTGGAKRWHTDPQYLEGSEIVDPKYNQVWKLEGRRGGETHGRMSLLEENGIEGCGEALMSSPGTLTAFVDYCFDRYSADSYDLIFWDHGGGPAYGFGYDCRGGALTLKETSEAFFDSKLICSGNKFELIDYDACLMGSAEVISALGDYADYFVCSPEETPGGGQDYRSFLNAVKDNPSMNGFEIGKVIADDFVNAYKGSEADGECAVTAVVDVNKFRNRVIPLLNAACGILLDEATRRGENGRYSFYDEIYSTGAAYSYGSDNYCLADLSSLASALSCSQIEENDMSDKEAESCSNRYTTILTELMSVMAGGGNDTVYFGKSDGIRSPVSGRNLRNADGNVFAFRSNAEAYVCPTGLSVFTPSTNIGSVCDYVAAMRETAEAMPDGNEKSFLERYTSAVACYSIIAIFGNTVYGLANSGAGNITYNDVKNKSCSPIIDYLAEYVFSGRDETEKYLSEIVSQQAEEAVSADKVTVKRNSRIITVRDTSSMTLTGAFSGVRVWGEPKSLEFKTLMSLHGYSYLNRQKSFPDGFSFTPGSTQPLNLDYSGSVLNCELQKVPESIPAVYDGSGEPLIADIRYTDEAHTKGYIPIVVLKNLREEKNYYLYVSLSDGEWKIDGLKRKIGDTEFVRMNGEAFSSGSGDISYTTVSEMTDALDGRTTLLPISDFRAVDNTKENWGMSVHELNLSELPVAYHCAELYSLTDIYGNTTDVTRLIKQAETAVSAGDADGDGRLTISDATAVQKYIARLPLPQSFDPEAADMNSDGAITIDDATLIQKSLAKIQLQVF